MKKELLIFGAVFILLSSLVVAVNYSNDVAGELTSNLGENITDIGNINEKTDKILTQEIEIPDDFKFLTRVLFGLKSDEKVDLQTFVILIGLWIILLILIVSILAITPFFGSVLMRWVAGFTITVLIAITGAIRDIAVFFFGLGNLFGALEKWNLLRFVFVIIILIILFFVFLKALKWFKGMRNVEQATNVGEDIGFMARVARVFRRIRGED